MDERQCAAGSRSGGEPAPGNISCAGATPIWTWNDAFGRCDVEVDGVRYPANVDGKQGLLSYINAHPTLRLILRMAFDSQTTTYTLSNLDSVNHRIRLIWIDKQGHPTGGIGSTTGDFSNPTSFGDFTDDLWKDCVCLDAADAAPDNTDLYTPAILALNPVAYYLMNEADGTVLKDYSLSGIDGEIVGPSTDLTRRGSILRRGSLGSLRFGGYNGGAYECSVSDQVAGDLFQKLAGQNKSCTIAFWFLQRDVNEYNWLFAYATNSLFGHSNYRMIGYDHQNGNFNVESPSSSNVLATSNLNGVVNIAHFVVWRKNHINGTYSLTVDGITQTVAGNASPETMGEGFRFPASYGNSNYILHGEMSDMSVFDYALTDTAISDLYSKGLINT